MATKDKIDSKQIADLVLSQANDLGEVLRGAANSAINSSKKILNSFNDTDKKDAVVEGLDSLKITISDLEIKINGVVNVANYILTNIQEKTRL